MRRFRSHGWDAAAAGEDIEPEAIKKAGMSQTWTNEVSLTKDRQALAIDRSR